MGVGDARDWEGETGEREDGEGECGRERWAKRRRGGREGEREDGEGECGREIQVHRESGRNPNRFTDKIHQINKIKHDV